MEVEHFNHTRGVPYTVTEPRTDMGLKAWAEHDRKAREKATEVLSEDVE